MTNWSMQLGVLIEVALAMILGGIVGIERETANKPAGCRTHASGRRGSPSCRP